MSDMQQVSWDHRCEISREINVIGKTDSECAVRVIRCEISREINVMGKTVDGSSVSSIQYSDSECARKRLSGSNAVTNGHGIVRESWSFSFQYSASLS